jgi:hypothetical protein
MPALANNRHERFAQLIALGASPRSAYIECGYKDSPYSRPNGSKLKHSPTVKQRVNELLQEWGESCKVQLSWVQHELLAIAEGRAVSRTVVNGKGEETKERDRLAALLGLLRSLGVTDTSVNVTATAAAGVAPQLTDEMRIEALAKLLQRQEQEPVAEMSVEETVAAIHREMRALELE